ncbi:MAG: T9SS type A sorting domain-containing protein, partial [Chitinophagales bacterium]|nr:T9SS type A sorting domain-containing protein [Chitinophagales bacterium]
LATGRYLEQGTLQCFLLKTDVDGNKVFLKTYGDTLQHTTGYGLAIALDGNYVVTGSSTLNQNSFQDYPDEFLMKTNTDGDTLWCRSYAGTNIEGSENGSSVVVAPDGSFAVGVATFSYPSVGYVPNKHCVLKTDKDGHMQFMRAYNSGGSHYPYLTASKGSDGYVLSGFSNFYTPQHFSAMLIKLDTGFHSGCNEIDETDLTTESHMPVTIHEPAVFSSSGGILINSTPEDDFVLDDTTLCFSSLDSCLIINQVNELEYLSGGVSVYPNPANEFLNVVINVNEKSNCIISIIDLSGRIIFNEEINLITGNNSFSFPIAEIADGTFFMRIISEKETEVKKIIISH